MGCRVIDAVDSFGLEMFDMSGVEFGKNTKRSAIATNM